MSFYLKETLKYLMRSRLVSFKEIKEVERLYLMNQDELHQYKEKKFLETFRTAYTKSNFYKSFYSSSGIELEDIKTLEDIGKLPVLTKDLVRENAKDILTVPDWKTFKAPTGGTTGSPLIVRQSYHAIKMEEAFFRIMRLQYGYNMDDRTVSFRGYMVEDKFDAKIDLANRLFLSSYNINRDNTRRYAEAINNYKPTALLGHPSTLYNLGLFLTQEDIKLNVPFALTASEKLYDFQRDLIAEVFGSKVYEHYGCTEKTILFAQDVNGRDLYEVPGYSVNEPAGNYIISTALHNNVFPLIRYKMSDQIEYEETKDGIKIKSVLGRTEDIIICKDGTKIGRTDDMLTSAKNIKMAQIVQEEIGIINLNIVPESGFNDTNQEQILKKLYNLIGKDRIEVKINLISQDEIIYTARNKFNFVVSKIK